MNSAGDGCTGYGRERHDMPVPRRGLWCGDLQMMALLSFCCLPLPARAATTTATAATTATAIILRTCTPTVTASGAPNQARTSCTCTQLCRKAVRHSALECALLQRSDGVGRADGGGSVGNADVAEPGR